MPGAHDLEELWSMPTAAASPPLLVTALTGLDEKLLPWYRSRSTRSLCREIAPLVGKAIDGRAQYEAVCQLVRLVGVVLWERECDATSDIAD
jgi:hypothetical protein